MVMKSARALRRLIKPNSQGTRIICDAYHNLALAIGLLCHEPIYPQSDPLFSVLKIRTDAAR